jgi:hypothetical protein
VGLDERRWSQATWVGIVHEFACAAVILGDVFANLEYHHLPEIRMLPFCIAVLRSAKFDYAHKLAPIDRYRPSSTQANAKDCPLTLGNRTLNLISNPALVPMAVLFER